MGFGVTLMLPVAPELAFLVVVPGVAAGAAPLGGAGAGLVAFDEGGAAAGAFAVFVFDGVLVSHALVAVRPKTRLNNKQSCRLVFDTFISGKLLTRIDLK